MPYLIATSYFVHSSALWATSAAHGREFETITWKPTDPVA